MVEDAGLTFIGPKSEVILKMGNKNIARNLMHKNGIPVVPGTEALNKESIETIKLEAEKIGYPVILTASGGGGGRGIREVWDPADLESSYERVVKERLRRFLITMKFLWKSLLKSHATLSFKF